MADTYAPLAIEELTRISRYHDAEAVLNSTSGATGDEPRQLALRGDRRRAD